MKLGLRHPMPPVQKDGQVLYGGNQAWLPWDYMKKSGCGTIAGTDFLWYLDHYHSHFQTEFFRESLQDGIREIPMENYSELVDRMRKHYFPVLPFLGMSGWSLAFGLNRYFRKYQIPYRAHWGVRLKCLWKYIEGMLKADVPVPLTVGQNTPFFFTKHKVAFYEKRPDGSMCAVRYVKAHFVTVTGMDEEWVRITSWGREFFISKKEYIEYVKRYSSLFVSNIITISRR